MPPVSQTGMTIADLLRPEISKEDKPIWDINLWSPLRLEDPAYLEVWIDFGDSYAEYRKTYRLNIVRCKDVEAAQPTDMGERGLGSSQANPSE